MQELTDLITFIFELKVAGYRLIGCESFLFIWVLFNSCHRKKLNCGTEKLYL